MSVVPRKIIELIRATVIEYLKKMESEVIKMQDISGKRLKLIMQSVVANVVYYHTEKLTWFTINVIATSTGTENKLFTIN